MLQHGKIESRIFPFFIHTIRFILFWFEQEINEKRTREKRERHEHHCRCSPSLSAVQERVYWRGDQWTLPRRPYWGYLVLLAGSWLDNVALGVAGNGGGGRQKCPRKEREFLSLFRFSQDADAKRCKRAKAWINKLLSCGCCKKRNY